MYFSQVPLALEKYKSISSQRPETWMLGLRVRKKQLTNDTCSTTAGVDDEAESREKLR